MRRTQSKQGRGRGVRECATAPRIALQRALGLVLFGTVVLVTACSGDSSTAGAPTAEPRPEETGSANTAPASPARGTAGSLAPSESIGAGASAVPVTSTDDVGSPTTTGTGSTTASPGLASTSTVSSEAPISTGIADAIHITVPPVPVELAPAVGATDVAHFGDGLSVRLADVQAIDVTTELPGEIGGPSLQFDIEFTNGSNAPIDLNTVQINAEFGDATPAVEITTDPARAVQGRLQVGQVASGRYVFNIPLEQRSRVQLFVSHSATAPTIVIEGNFAP